MLCINRLYKYEDMLKSKGVELFYTNPIQIQLITQSLGSEYTWFRDYSNELVDNLIQYFPNLPELKKIQNALGKGKKARLVFKPNDKTIRSMENKDKFLDDFRASSAFRKMIRDYKQLFFDNKYIQELDEYTMIRTTDIIMADNVDEIHDMCYFNQRIFAIHIMKHNKTDEEVAELIKTTKYTLISSQYPNIFTIPDDGIRTAMLLKTVELMEK